MQTLHNYIYFPENIENYITNTEEAKDIMKDFFMTIDLADCEKESKLYYSKSNKDNFFENFKIIEEFLDINLGHNDFEATLNTLCTENEIMPVEESSTCKLTTFDSRTNSLNVKQKNPVILFDIVKRNKGLKENDKQIVLNFLNSFSSQNPIFIIVNCLDEVKAIHIAFVTNFSELDTWLIKNRLQRTFNNTDTRHIENSGNHKKDKSTGEYKSPLLGGIGGRHNAKILLNNAVGDKRSNSNNLDLMNYDDSKKEYIWYEDENTNNQYHAYHLVKAYSYTRDVKAIKRIPKRVINIFEYRNKTTK